MNVKLLLAGSGRLATRSKNQSVFVVAAGRANAMRNNVGTAILAGHEISLYNGMMGPPGTLLLLRGFSFRNRHVLSDWTEPYQWQPIICY